MSIDARMRSIRIICGYLINGLTLSKYAYCRCKPIIRLVSYRPFHVSLYAGCMNAFNSDGCE